MSDWFESWFDTKYYHILYKNRDYSEAQQFLDNLINHLQPDLESKILDLACGKGRHSIYLNKKGYDVTGVDLSSQSILHASQFASPRLHFQTHDMRLPYQTEAFNYIFNVFTSFGYFESDLEDEKVIQSMYSNLKSNGILVLDYLNPVKAISSLVSYEEKEIDGIVFKISKEIINGFIVKTINFSDSDNFEYQEKVKLIDEDSFKSMFSKAGFEIQSVFGDYNLNDYNSDNSDRLILIGQKKEA